MKRAEFLSKIIQKKKIDKEIYDISMQIDDFPIAREILKKIDNSVHLIAFLNANNQQIAIIEKGDLYRKNIALVRDASLRSQSKKFLDDLLDLKVLQIRKALIRKTKPKTTAKEAKPKTTAKEAKPKTAAKEVKPKTTAKEVKPKTAAKEVKPKTTPKEVKPKTAAKEVKPKTSVKEISPNNEIKSKNYLNYQFFEEVISKKIYKTYAKQDLYKKNDLLKDQSLNPINSALFDEGINSFQSGKDFVEAMKFFNAIYESQEFTKMSNYLKVTLHNYRAFTFFSLKEFKKANDEFNFAIILDSNNDTLLNNRGRCNFKNKEWKLAIIDFDNAINISKKFEYYYYRGCSKSNLGIYEDAIKDFNTALELKEKSKINKTYEKLLLSEINIERRKTLNLLLDSENQKKLNNKNQIENNNKITLLYRGNTYTKNKTNNVSSIKEKNLKIKTQLKDFKKNTKKENNYESLWGESKEVEEEKIRKYEEEYKADRQRLKNMTERERELAFQKKMKKYEESKKSRKSK